MEYFLKAVDEINLKDISSVAQKLLSSPLTMASYGNGSSQFSWNLNTGFSCFIGTHFRLTCWFCSCFAVINVPRYDSVSSKLKGKWNCLCQTWRVFDLFSTVLCICIPFSCFYYKMLLKIRSLGASIFNNKLFIPSKQNISEIAYADNGTCMFLLNSMTFVMVWEKVSIFLHFCFTNYPKQILEWFFT